MLAIKDHLDRALAAVSEELRADETAANFLAGIEATARELDAVFARNGVTRVESKGEKLDPHKHQAMVEIPNDEVEPGTIIEEMQAGYTLKDRLLRPALVGVARGVKKGQATVSDLEGFRERLLEWIGGAAATRPSPN